jgi:hypothetical protein
MNFEETTEFSREYKRFAKKWHSLPDDLADAKQAIEGLYIKQGNLDTGIYRQMFFNGKNATILRSSDDLEVVKMRLDCADLARKNSLRLIFIYIKTRSGIMLLELYSKSEKSREDVDRIKKYIASL